MIAVDTNLLVYAHREDSPWHAGATQSIAVLTDSPSSWAIPWPCLHEFLSIVTHPRVFKTPTPMALALAQVEAWTESSDLVLLSEGPEYWKDIRGVLVASQVSGPRVHDAHIAALCRYHGVEEIWSADRDFGRFSGIRVRNPLVPSP